MLAKVKYDQEQFDRVFALCETNDKDASSALAALLAASMKTRPKDEMSTRDHVAHWQHDSIPSSPPWAIRHTQSFAKYPTTWFTRFEKMWDHIRICLGLKSASGPD